MRMLLVGPCCVLVALAGAASGQQLPDADGNPHLPADEVVWRSGQCREAGMRLDADIDHEQDRPYTLVLFLHGPGLRTGICYWNREYGVTGDPIYVAVFTSNPDVWDPTSASFDPCAIESNAPMILIRDGVKPAPPKPAGIRVDESYVRRYLPRTCFNGQVAVTIGGTNANAPSARVNLEQAQRYRASIQLGVAFSPVHDRSYGLRPTDDGNVIFDEGPEGVGPEYFASLLLYAIPRYVEGLFRNERYLGRDVVHDDNVLDRVGGIIGVGLTSPSKRFVAGLGIELVTGISVVGLWQYAQTTTLAGGLSEDDPFGGSASDIPTRMDWKSDWVWGLSIDLLYTVQLFGN